MKKLIALIFLAISLSSCASLTTGQTQTVSVNSSPVDGAKCELKNSDGTWYVTTPGSTTIDKAYGSLNVDCKKSGWSGSAIVESKTQAMAFGNVIAGGIIGAGVDMATGAAYEYPNNIHVKMTSQVAKK